MLYPGSCHCGNIAFVYETDAPVALRACGCSFCRRHRARSASDPAGSVRLFVRAPERATRYRFGLRLADMLHCATCGVYAGAFMEDVAVLNANTFDEEIDGEGTPYDYDGETPEARLARRRARWTPIAERLEGTAALRAQLLAMAELDLRVRAELAADGSRGGSPGFPGRGGGAPLFDGYHPRMERVHLRNALRLAVVLDEIGWPTRGALGEDGAAAAWLIAQHAISRPDFMRRAAALLGEAAARGEAAPLHAAMLDDRVRTYEGRPQLHGTQLDWDEAGRLIPLPVDDERKVDDRRAALGLRPLAEEIARRREVAEPPPADAAARRRELETWLKRVGWRR